MTVVLDYTFANNTASGGFDAAAGELRIAVHNYPYVFVNSTLAIELALYTRTPSPELAQENEQEIGSRDGLQLFAVKTPAQVSLEAGSSVSAPGTPNATSGEKQHVAKMVLPPSTAHLRRAVCYEGLSLNLTALGEQPANVATRVHGG